MVNYSSDIKVRILLVHYILPLVMFTIAVTCFSFEDTLTNVVFGSLVALAFVLNLSLSRRRYLYSFDPLSGGLEISYFNVFLQRKTVQVPASELAGIGRLQVDPITQCPTLKVKVDNKWQGFSILSKGLRDAARLFFHAANASLL
jgi:hypothetical protein